MSRVFTYWAILSLVGCGAWGDTLYRETFDQDAGGWTTIDPGSAVAQTQSNQAHEGQALELTFKNSAGALPAAAIKLNPPNLVGAKAVRFWARTNRDTVVTVLLQESGGGRYATMSWLPADTWRHLEFSVDRLRLSTDTDDANGQLDLGQVVGLGVADLAGMLNLDGDSPQQRALWIDDFQVDTEPALTAYSATGTLPFTLDKFDTDVVPWLAAGGGQLVPDSTKGQLSWTYARPQGDPPIVALVGMVGPLPQTTDALLVLTLTSAKPRLMALMLQEEDRPPVGERGFFSTFELFGGPEPQTVAISLRSLTLEDKYKTTKPGPLNLARVDKLLIADLDVGIRGATEPNTIELQEVLLVP